MRIPCDTSLCYVDECGVDPNIARLVGRAPRGERVVAERPGHREKRLNVLAGLVGTEVIAPFYLKETTNGSRFEAWFNWYLCPALPPRSVIIMDNARFHRKTEVRRIAKQFGHSVIFLPKYSPDKNPIEHTWANLKNWLRIHAHQYPGVQDAIIDYFR